MINNINYTNIRVILDNCLQNELLQDLTLELLVGYVIKFNGIYNIPLLYTQKTSTIKIEDYRGLLPLDLISVVQVRDIASNTALPELSSTFFSPNNVIKGFKTLGKCIFTNLKSGDLEIVYMAVPIDDEGYPQILDNEKYKNALELYIKRDRFTKYFELGKLHLNILQNVLQEYSWAAGQLEEELKTPSMSEWENISQEHNKLIQRSGQFRRGFSNLGVPEIYKIH